MAEGSLTAAKWGSFRVQSYATRETGACFVRCSHTKVRFRRRITKNLRYPRRPQLPPDIGPTLYLRKPSSESESKENEEEKNEELSDNDWSTQEIDAISSLFQRRLPQNPIQISKQKPLPLSSPHKLHPLALPTPKQRRNTKENLFPRSPVASRVHKDPIFLVNLARQISTHNDVHSILDKCSRFLRKGSLSLTIRELGLMGFPEKALETFCWAKAQPHLYPDEKLLASAIEVSSTSNNLKLPLHLDELASIASKPVIESTAKGLIKGGKLKLASKLLQISHSKGRAISSQVHTKLILELSKNPDKHIFAGNLLDELSERESLSLSETDCTSLMKVCVKLKRFEVVERLYDWYKEQGKEVNVVMYTAVLHSRYSEGRYRAAMEVVWEMEGEDCLMDLPAYRVVIKLLCAMEDVGRAVRYFWRLKEDGFAPTYDVYVEMMKLFLSCGRVRKWEEIREEALLAGFCFPKDHD